LIRHFYAYSAYGEATTLGPDGGNSIQYTGRENDGTGQQFNRARYYDYLLKQWTSEDPIGLRGGINNRSYVGGNPIAFTDPYGLINYVKAAVAVGNGIIGTVSIAGGAASIVGGISVAPSGVGVPVSVGAIAFGAYRINAGVAAWRRGQQQFFEALRECESEGSWRNVLGLLPFGQHFDDKDETIQSFVQDFLNKPTNKKIIDGLQYGTYGGH